MKNFYRILSVALVFGLALAARAGDDKTKEPVSEAALIKMVKADIEDEVIVALVKKRGIDFKPDAATIKRLKKAGVSDTVIAALKPAEEDAKPAEHSEKTLGTGKYQKGLVIDITEIKRTSDNFLRVSYQFRNPTELSVTFTPGYFFLQEMYYVEAGGKYKYTVIKDDKGKWVASGTPTTTLRPGEKAEYWAKFGQPGRGIKHITLYFKDAEPIEDVPLPPAK